LRILLVSVTFDIDSGRKIMPISSGAVLLLLSAFALFGVAAGYCVSAKTYRGFAREEISSRMWTQLSSHDQQSAQVSAGIALALVIAALFL
jgi:hypothetical protein